MNTSKQEKYIFREFSSDSLVKTLKNDETTPSEEKIIDAVVAHFNDVVHSEEDNTENTVNYNSPFYTETDLEGLKSKAYQDGFEAGLNESKKTYEEKITELEEKKNLIEAIKEKIGKFEPVNNPLAEYVELLGLLVRELSDKFFIDLQSNQEKIIKKQLKTLLETCYKGGEVIIRVSDSSANFCRSLVSSDSLGRNFDFVNVIADSNINNSDVIIEYKETKLIFDKEDVKKQIEQIVKHFTLDGE